MKKKFLVGLLLLLNLCIISQSQGQNFTLTAQFNDRVYPYYWNTKDDVSLSYLAINTSYGVVIGSNQYSSEQQWINFTATEKHVKLIFRQDSAPYDNQSNKLTELEFSLYSITSNTDTSPTLLDRLTLQIVYPTDQANYGSLAERISQIVIILVLSFIGVSMIVSIFMRYA